MIRRLAAVVAALALCGGAATAPGSHSFSFVQVGPDKEAADAPYPLSRMSDAGTFAVPAPISRDGLQVQGASSLTGSEFEHRDGPVRLLLRMERAELAAFADGSTMLLFRIRVLASNDPACPVGSTGPMHILDEAHGRDAIRMVLCPYIHEHYFDQTRGRVSVTIR